MRYLIIFLLGLCNAVNAQEKFLSLDAVFDIIKQFHPVVKQVSIQVQQADASIMASRGSFDPAAYYEIERKTFDGVNYFAYSNPSLKIPTWFGLEIKGGIENNTGSRLNPNLTVGKNTYLGVSMPILKGLLFDKRRAAVQQAKIFKNLSQQEQLQAVNDLLHEAGAAYWKWAAAFQLNEILKKAIVANEQRVSFVKKSWQSGDRAAVDTIEAISQLQSIQVMQSQAWLDFKKSGLVLSNFMWTAASQPYELSDDVLPDTSWLYVQLEKFPLPVLSETLQMAMNQHPKLTGISLKTDILEIDKRSKFQSLLPKLDLNYNFLNKGYGLSKSFASPLFENNFKYGLQFAVPLFQREARGDYRNASLKLQYNQLELDQTKLEISNKVRAAFNEILAVKDQVTLMQRNMLNQQKLLEVEEIKFKMGETTMFLVNSREIKLLETALKYTELRTKFFNSLVSTQAAAGLLR